MSDDANVNKAQKGSYPGAFLSCRVRVLGFTSNFVECLIDPPRVCGNRLLHGERHICLHPNRQAILQAGNKEQVKPPDVVISEKLHLTIPSDLSVANPGHYQSCRARATSSTFDFTECLTKRHKNCFYRHPAGWSCHHPKRQAIVEYTDNLKRQH